MKIIQMYSCLLRFAVYRDFMHLHFTVRTIPICRNTHTYSISAPQAKANCHGNSLLKGVWVSWLYLNVRIVAQTEEEMGCIDLIRVNLELLDCWRRRVISV